MAPSRTGTRSDCPGLDVTVIDFTVPLTGSTLVRSGGMTPSEPSSARLNDGVAGTEAGGVVLGVTVGVAASLTLTDLEGFGRAEAPGGRVFTIGATVGGRGAGGGGSSGLAGGRPSTEPVGEPAGSLVVV